MSNRTKKILKIITIVLAVVLIGLIIYNIFFKKEPTVTPGPAGEEIIISEEFAPEAKERLVAITDEAVSAAGLKSGNHIIYASWNGEIKTIDFNGQNELKLGAVPGERLGEVKISAGGNLVGLKHFLPSGRFRWAVFDAEKKSVKTLPDNAENLAFDPKGGGLVASFAQAGASDLALIDTATSKTTRLVSTRIPDLVLDWASSDTVALKTRPSGLAYGLAYLFNIKTKKINRLIGSTYGLTSSFSPDVNKILYSKTNSDGRDLELKVLNIPKKTEINLNILSLPEKCAWSQDNRTLFCGTINTNENPIMPDDYYKDKIENDGENIVRINLDTGQTQKLIGGTISAEKLFLSPDESYLFFINKKDGRLYRLTL